MSFPLNSFPAAVARYQASDPARAYRERLIRRLDAWASARRYYAAHLCDARLPFSALTDEALYYLQRRIASDVWRERQTNRRNRAIHDARRAPVLQAAE